VGPLPGQSGRRNGPRARGRAALQHGPVEQAFAQRRQQVETHGCASGTPAENRHSVRVSVETGHVLAHPAQRRHLILQPVVARQRVVLRAQEPCFPKHANVSNSGKITTPFRVPQTVPLLRLFGLNEQK